MLKATILLTIFAGLSSALRIQTETPQHSFETGTHAKWSYGGFYSYKERYNSPSALKA